MLIGKPAAIPSSEITPKATYLNRRNFLAGAAIAGAAAVTGVAFRDLADLVDPSLTAHANTKIDGLQKSPFSTTEKETPYKDVTNYNNFYEFSTDKYEPAGLAKNFKTRPWTVTIDGLVKKKQVLDVRRNHQDGCSRRAHLPSSLCRRLVNRRPLGRIFPERTDQARRPPTQSKVCRVHRAITIPSRCPMEGMPEIRLPYVEGLRIDEAMHPLAMLVVGLYGEVLPNQNGAPLRLAVPWKYGFKSIKSIVKIKLVEKEPPHHLESGQRARIRFLFQCESRGRSSALEPGKGAQAAGHGDAPDAQVQRNRSIRSPASTPAWISRRTSRNL